MGANIPGGLAENRRKNLIFHTIWSLRSCTLPSSLNNSPVGSFSFLLLHWAIRFLCFHLHSSSLQHQHVSWVIEANGLNQDAVQDGFHLSSYLITAKYLFFNTEEGATAVNLTTHTSDSQCSEASGFVFPASVSTLDIPRDFPDHSSLPSTCVQLASSTLTSATEASPCKVNISPKAEASILADAECHNTLLSASGCPDKTTRDDAAAGRDYGRTAWAAVTLAFVLIVGLGLVGY